MRVAYVCTDSGVPVFGSKGCSVHVRQIIRALLRRGYEVELFGRRWGGDAPQDLRSVRCHQLEPINKCPVAEREMRLLAANHQLRNSLKSQAPFDLIYERHALWSHAAMQFAHDSDTPSLLEVNAPLIDEQQQHRELLAKDEAQRSTSLAVSKAKGVITVTSQVADYVRRFLTASTRLQVEGNGVNPSDYSDCRKPIWERTQSRQDQADSLPYVIGFVGTMRPWHGMSILGSAFCEFHAIHPDSRLLMVGDGSARTELFSALTPAAAQAVTITGHVPHEQIAGYLQQMDVAVAPYPATKEFYFSPLKLMEYMAAGLPVVVSRQGDIPRLVQHEINGLLVAPGDVSQLVAAWMRLKQQPNFARQLGRRAATTIENKHTWDSVLGRSLALVGLNTEDSNDCLQARISG